MSKMIQKLKGKRGETLMESLFAILIFTFASITMYSMVTSAMNINNKARAADQVHQDQMIAAESAQGEGKSASVSLKLTQTPAGADDDSLGSVDVKVFGGEGELYAYYVDGSHDAKGDD